MSELPYYYVKSCSPPLALIYTHLQWVLSYHSGIQDRMKYFRSTYSLLALARVLSFWRPAATVIAPLSSESGFSKPLYFV